MTHSAVSYILGFVIGDGNISKTNYLIRLYDQNQQFVEKTLKALFEQSFGIVPKVSFDKSNNSYLLYKGSKVVWQQLHDLGVPVGRKARTIVIPDHIVLADSTTKSFFISGVFDAEGSLASFAEEDRHPRGYPYFELKMFNPKFVEGLGKLLV